MCSLILIYIVHRKSIKSHVAATGFKSKTNFNWLKKPSSLQNDTVTANWYGM